MDTEKNVRRFLTTLSTQEISDSVYLDGVDFEFDGFDKIIDGIISLHNDVLTVKRMVEHNFKSDSGESLLPNSREAKNKIFQESYKKAVVLSKLLGNAFVKESVIKRMVAIEKLENQYRGLM